MPHKIYIFQQVSILWKFPYIHACLLSCFNRVWLFATPWTVAHQAHFSLSFSRPEYWSRLPSPPPGDPLDPGFKSTSPVIPALQVESLPTEPPGKPLISIPVFNIPLGTSRPSGVSLESTQLWLACIHLRSPIVSWGTNPCLIRHIYYTIIWDVLCISGCFPCSRRLYKYDTLLLTNTSVYSLLGFFGHHVCNSRWILMAEKRQRWYKIFSPTYMMQASSGYSAGQSATAKCSNSQALAPHVGGIVTFRSFLNKFWKKIIKSS